MREDTLKDSYNATRSIRAFMLKQSELQSKAVYLPKTSSIGWSEKREMRASRKNTQAHRTDERRVLSFKGMRFF